MKPDAVVVLSRLPERLPGLADLAAHADVLARIYQPLQQGLDAAGQTVYLLPATISQPERQALDAAGLTPNRLCLPAHDQVVALLQQKAARADLQRAADAFIASLNSAPLWWQSLLPAVVLGLQLPTHAAAPLDTGSSRCACCFHPPWANDLTQIALFRYRAGTCWGNYGPQDALQVLLGSETEVWPQATPRDIWIWHRVLDILRTLPASSRYSQARKALRQAGWLNKNSLMRCESLLDALAWIGILETPEFPGLMSRFTSAIYRDRRPNTLVEVSAPLAWWQAEHGLNESLIDRLFGHCVCPAQEPPAPAPGATVPKKARSTGLRNLPGPLAAGDVYAIQCREDLWGTAYCHEVVCDERGIERGRMELLDYLAPQPPQADQLHGLHLSTRTRGMRTQCWCSSLLKTPGVKRIATGIAPYISAVPAPERITYAQAKQLAWEARWHFAEV
ncbi:hypothetical protein [Niveibacterium terrae]|uniref:hypothetical protein n=1 Tax=Niveibacterium terrae TaxID=3373598 RepID=UPI003A8FC917